MEDAAVAWVMELERAAGRQPRDTRHERGAPADIDSPPRLIEVKAYGGSARGSLLWREGAQVRTARQLPDRFHLDVVDHLRPGRAGMHLHDLHGARLARLLERASEHRHFEVTWPVADYDAGPPGLA